LIQLPRHPPVSVVSARPRQCSVCVFHGQRLKFKTSALDHSHRLFWSTEIPLTPSQPSHISEVYSHPMDTADQTFACGRITLASSVMSSLDCFWKERRLPLPIKIRVYLALVQSVLLYASETWTLTSADAESLKAFHMKCQRRILRISWRQFVRNSEISALNGLHAINDVIRHRRIAVFGHIARLQDSTTAHKALHTVSRQPLTRSSSPSLLESSAWSPTWQMD